MSIQTRSSLMSIQVLPFPALNHRSQLTCTDSAAGGDEITLGNSSSPKYMAYGLKTSASVLLSCDISSLSEAIVVFEIIISPLSVRVRCHCSLGLFVTLRRPSFYNATSSSLCYGTRAKECGTLLDLCRKSCISSLLEQ